ncbi:hypothetical protein H4R35_002237 [Dimargaris xerosporica]|nr:hypothetical protein H4R35_002237 [Dimargaris xerosporica]
MPVVSTPGVTTMLQGDTPAYTVLAPEAHKSSNAAAVFHLVCVMAGTGILQLPYCMKLGGWLSVFLILLAAAASNYTGQLIIKLLYIHDGVRLTSFSDVAGAAYGTRGRLVTRIFKDISSIGTCTLYLILAGYNLNALLTPTSGILGVRLWILGCALVTAVPYIGMKTIQDAVILSVFGVMTTGIMVVIVLSLSMMDLPAHPVHSYTLVDLYGFPVALSAICFSFGGIVVWPQVEEGLREPQDWPRMLSLATTIVCIMYLLVAAVGYAVYDVEALSPILLNLPKGFALTTGNLMVTIHVLLTTPIMLSSVSNEFENAWYQSATTDSEWAQFGIRAVVRSVTMLVTAVCAIFVPYFADVMSLLGSLAFSTLIFVFPVVFYFKLSPEPQTRRRRLMHWGIVLIGAACCIVGSYQAILALARDFEVSGSN